MRLIRRILDVLRADARNHADPHAEPWAPVILPASLAVRCQELLRTSSHAGEGREALFYWAGIAHRRGGVVTTLVCPRTQATFGSVATSLGENARIIEWLTNRGLVLVGQAHSHPPGAGVVHSPGDDAMTFSPFEGQVSVVVPNYAELERGFFRSWGIHRFRDGRFHFVPSDRRDDHLRIVPTSLDESLHCPALALADCDGFPSD